MTGRTVKLKKKPNVRKQIVFYHPPVLDAFIPYNGRFAVQRKQYKTSGNVTVKKHVHKGVDLFPRRKTLLTKKKHHVYSVTSGRVSYVINNPTGSGGNIVEVIDDNGGKARYLHLGEISVRKGQFLMPGQIIGTVGKTGLSRKATIYSIHLHFEYRVRQGRKWVPVDPTKALKDVERRYKELGKLLPKKIDRKVS